MTEEQYIKAKRLKKQIDELSIGRSRLSKAFANLKRNEIDKKEIETIYNDYSIVLDAMTAIRDKEFKEL